MTTGNEWRDIEDKRSFSGLTNYVSPEDFVVFRLTQLMILLSEVGHEDGKAIELERLGYYDFFAANPFAIFNSSDKSQHAQLHQASFDERQLSYASTGSRFANRRKRLQHDVAILVAYRLARPQPGGYTITAAGQEFVSSLTALYVDQYRDSVKVIHSRLRQLSDPQVAQAARGWLKTPSLLLDLYGSADSDTAVDSYIRGDA